MEGGSAYAAFKALKAERRSRRQQQSAGGATEVERAKEAQRARQSRLTMSARVDGQQLDGHAEQEEEEEEVAKPKQMTLEERWAAEDAAAGKVDRAPAAAAQPSGLDAVGPLMSKASTLLGDGKVAEARAEWESAQGILAAAEVVSPPLSASGTGEGGAISTHIEIPSAEEMMRQMQERRATRNAEKIARMEPILDDQQLERYREHLEAPNGRFQQMLLGVESESTIEMSLIHI